MRTYDIITYFLVVAGAIGIISSAKKSIGQELQNNITLDQIAQNTTSVNDINEERFNLFNQLADIDSSKFNELKNSNPIEFIKEKNLFGTDYNNLLKNMENHLSKLTQDETKEYYSLSSDLRTLESFQKILLPTFILGEYEPDFTDFTGMIFHSKYIANYLDNTKNFKLDLEKLAFDEAKKCLEDGLFNEIWGHLGVVRKLTNLNKETDYENELIKIAYNEAKKKVNEETFAKLTNPKNIEYWNNLEPTKFISFARQLSGSWNKIKQSEMELIEISYDKAEKHINKKEYKETSLRIFYARLIANGTNYNITPFEKKLTNMLIHNLEQAILNNENSENHYNFAKSIAEFNNFKTELSYIKSLKKK